MVTRIKMMCAFLAVAALGAVPAISGAEDATPTRSADRAGKWEIIIPVEYTAESTIKGENGSSAHIDDDFGIELGVGYNFNDNFQLNSFLNFNSLSYQATVPNDKGVMEKYSNYMDTFSMNLNGVYYLLKGNITPFISGGVGFTYADTNVQNGKASTTCWYDPWWGYICDTYVPTKEETALNYNVGLGVRYDASRKFAIQGGYFKNWVDLGNASGTPDLDIWRISLIFKM